MSTDGGHAVCKALSPVQQQHKKQNSQTALLASSDTLTSSRRETAPCCDAVGKEGLADKGHRVSTRGTAYAPLKTKNNQNNSDTFSIHAHPASSAETFAAQRPLVTTDGKADTTPIVPAPVVGGEWAEWCSVQVRQWPPRLVRRNHPCWRAAGSRAAVAR